MIPVDAKEEHYRLFDLIWGGEEEQEVSKTTVEYIRRNTELPLQ